MVEEPCCSIKGGRQSSSSAGIPSILSTEINLSNSTSPSSLSAPPSLVNVYVYVILPSQLPPWPSSSLSHSTGRISPHSLVFLAVGRSVTHATSTATLHRNVGDGVGFAVGVAVVGTLLGCAMGPSVGMSVGPSVGGSLGASVVELVGAIVEPAVGSSLDRSVGLRLGAPAGFLVGSRDIFSLGGTVGPAVGTRLLISSSSTRQYNESSTVSDLALPPTDASV
mmetsp:Transcript_47034/g.142421  ORF Transcript_47034/g.142421 Transcript_47034/m.142421 type:complete len:223 (-) Transcript_47034:479-1147(-)